MEINTKTVKIEQTNMKSNCSPFSSLYCNLKIRLTGSLNENNLNDLYNCNLCNKCGMASLNKHTREKAVSNDLIINHVAEIKENIRELGNSYGMARKNSANESVDLISTSDNDSKSQTKSKQLNQKSETILFRGCTPTYKTPEIIKSVERLFKSKNIEYSTINDENCCGNILFNLGDKNAGQQAVLKNIEKFKEEGVKRIITVCPGCYNAFHEYYKGENAFNPEIILAIDLLDDYTVEGDEYILQDSCHAKEKSGTIHKIFLDSKNVSKNPCCGAGAGVLAHNKTMAHSKASQLIENNQEKIVTYCPFCYLNLSSSSDQISDIYMLLDAQS